MNNKTVKGYVTCVQIFTEKGRPGEKREFIIFEEDKGILGDRHADGGNRQVSILLFGIRDWMDAQEEPGICFTRYKENVEISGLDASQFQKGMRLYIGEAELEITFVKRCFKECRYISEKRDCLLLHGAYYARVIKTGKVSVGDRVTIG